MHPSRLETAAQGSVRHLSGTVCTLPEKVDLFRGVPTAVSSADERREKIRCQKIKHSCFPKIAGDAPRKTFAQAAWQIVIADITMSLDNVLAVAPARRASTLGFWSSASPCPSPSWVLAATFIARLLQKHRRIAYVGLAVILYVALEMIYRGGMEVAPYLGWTTS